MYDVIDPYEDEIFDNILEYESNFRDYDEDPDYYYNHNSYYIGIYSLDKEFNNLLLASTITSNTFLKYKYEECVIYLNSFSIFEQKSVNKLEIMQLNISTDDPCLYNIVLKTFWLRLIQRNWKRILRERKEILKPKNLFNYLNKRQLGIKFAPIPSLYGMLHHLKNQ